MQVEKPVQSAIMRDYPEFGTEAGLGKLETYLLDRSYLTGYAISAADVEVYQRLQGKQGWNYSTWKGNRSSY